MLNVYIPSSCVESVIPVIKKIECVSTVAFNVIHKPCDLSSVRSANVRFLGTDLWVKTPFVYPFCCGGLRNEYPGQYYTAPNVDWIWLSSDFRDFETYLLDSIEKNSYQEVNVFIFKNFTGELARECSALDQQVHIQRATRNYSSKPWENFCNTILTLPEQQWGQFGANTSDWINIITPALSKYVKSQPRVIVDLGCGLGQTARSLALRYPSAQVYGFDSSEPAINVARNRFKLSNLEYKVASIGSPLPFSDKSVDLMISINALMYGASQSFTASESFRVLSQDGLIMHISRTLDSHLFWDFPRSFMGPTNFQLNAFDWISSSNSHGFKTFVHADPLAMTSCASFFYPAKIVSFAEAYTKLLDSEMSVASQTYKPWHSHAYIVHSSYANQSYSSLNSSSFLERTDRCLATILKSTPLLKDAAILAWNFNAGSLELCREAKQFISLNLPRSGAAIETVLVGKLFERNSEGD